MFTAATMTFDWTQGPLAEGLRCYAAGEFFAAHEAWESLWLAAPEPEKTFLQGVIQVAAAFEHQRRNNPLGTTRLLTAALRRLHPLPPAFGGLDLDLLRNDIRERLQLLADGAPISPLIPPRIRPLAR
jgi:predicted metal-dependent hydrolase